MIAKRPYGTTGIYVSALGLGAAQIGDPKLTESQVADVLNTALDSGCTLIDTAPSYGISEERIGRHLAARRDEMVLSTKLGYGIDGIEDWTGPCITAGVERALKRMRVSHIDIAHLHSCPQSTLQRGDVIDALDDAKRGGKIRAMAYSGDNEDLHYAVSCGRFDGFMASLNLCDQRVIDNVVPHIAGKGFIAKRAAANHPWRFDTQPVGDYCETYWQRWRTMNIDPLGLQWGELAIRFSSETPGVTSAIIGTASAARLAENVKWAAAGPLPAPRYTAVRDAFQEHGGAWRGEV
jgi:aryl-alcohol dehydrogenase-like predicted oxidoreductase